VITGGVLWAARAYARLDLGEPDSVARHCYQAPPTASCAILDASYSDEPPTARNAGVCSYGSGSSTFGFAVQAAAAPLCAALSMRHNPDKSRRSG